MTPALTMALQKMCGANGGGANWGLNVRRTAPQSSVTQCEETNFSQFYHIIVWALFHLWPGTSHEQLAEADCRTRQSVFMQERERATPYGASCLQGNVIMDTGWLSSQERHWTGALFDNKVWCVCEHFQRPQTLCTVVISHIREHSLCWMTVILTTE